MSGRQKQFVLVNSDLGATRQSICRLPVGKSTQWDNSRRMDWHSKSIYSTIGKGCTYCIITSDIKVEELVIKDNTNIQSQWVFTARVVMWPREVGRHTDNTRLASRHLWFDVLLIGLNTGFRSNRCMFVYLNRRRLLPTCNRQSLHAPVELKKQPDSSSFP